MQTSARLQELRTALEELATVEEPGSDTAELMANTEVQAARGVAWDGNQATSEL